MYALKPKDSNRFFFGCSNYKKDGSGCSNTESIEEKNKGIIMNVNYFINNNYNLIDHYQFNELYSSYVFEYNDYIIIIDDNFDIARTSKECFDYSKYCEMQNYYMIRSKMLLRFNFDNDEKILIKKIEDTIHSTSNLFEDNGGTFSNTHIDNTPTELLFEDIFVNAYGSEALECLRKEVAISYNGNKNYFIDYVIETKNGNFAFEENGINYHHPCVVGKEKYNELLDKQNTIVLLGYKLYRFSSDNLHFKEKVTEEIKSILPNKCEFIPKIIFKNNRGLELYKHQTDILKQLDIDRLNGKTTALIVIPTAAGKSEICISDLGKESIIKNANRILIMVPTLRIKEDWLERIEVIKDKYEVIDVEIYNTIYIKKNNLDQDYYDYIIFDEAHHAQAANCKSTIQYFTPKYLIGLTATDERLDNKKLEEVFGNYDVKLTLKEAIDRDVVCNIRAYRLESNINLSEVRYNGKDYNYADLEKTLIIDSRNELIANTIVKYFKPKEDFYKQGLVFCVNKNHAKKISKILNEKGIVSEAVYGGNSKNDEIFEKYKNKEIQFLCSCQLISEGWDSPQTEVVVMARPTLSKVLYLQQIGRGLRKYPGKECLYLIDVVDNYSAQLKPWNFNSLFHLSHYSDFIGIKNNNFDYLTILGLSEKEIAMKEIDIFTFEEKYKNYLSLEQAARELFIGTQTLNSWNKRNNYASLYLPIGSSKMPYFSESDIQKIREEKNLSIHNEDTILDDFTDFVDENTLTFSFKLVFLINAIKLADKEGNVNLTDLIKHYAFFYQSRIKKGLPVDKKSCVYNLDKLNDDTFVRQSILDNPFEKFERKRFFYHSKDLNLISFNPVLWNKMTKEYKQNIINKELQFLKEYYGKYGGYDNEYQF